MRRIGPEIDQIGVTALFDNASTQQRLDFPPQAAGAQPGHSREFSKVELTIRKHKQRSEQPRPCAAE